MTQSTNYLLELHYDCSSVDKRPVCFSAVWSIVIIISYAVFQKGT